MYEKIRLGVELLMSNKWNEKNSDGTFVHSHNQRGYLRRVARRRVKDIKYTNFDTCPSYVTNPQGTHNPNSTIPASTSKAHITAKSEYANYQRNVVDKRLGKTDVQVEKSENKYYKNIRPIPQEYVHYSILPSKDLEK